MVVLHFFRKLKRDARGTGPCVNVVYFHKLLQERTLICKRDHLGCNKRPNTTGLSINENILYCSVYCQIS